MGSTAFVSLLLALFVKHIIVVFILQTKEQLALKSDCYHPSGILFSVYHAIGTIAVVTASVGFSASIVPVAVLASIIRHYIDWAKANILNDWAVGDSPHHWWMLGLDQWLHCIIYVAIAYYYVL
jgi:hypothetical protein